MAKTADTRFDQVWATIVTMLRPLPDPTHQALVTYRNGMSPLERAAVGRGLSLRRDYRHAAPSMLRKMTGSYDAMRDAHRGEKADRGFERALVLILMFKHNSGNYHTDLARATADVPANMQPGEAWRRCLLELADTQAAVTAMKLRGNVPFTWPGWDGTRQRPLLAGCAIGRRGSEGPGTLGCFVTIGNAVYLLTNRHVAFQQGLGDDLILQPPHGLGGSMASDAIATITAEDPQHDAVIARITPGITCDNTTPEGVAITGHAVANLNDAVTKSGCATRRRHGTISNAAAPNVDAAGTQLTHQLLVERDSGLDLQPTVPFQVQGDSGSVVLNHHGQVVALLHGQGSFDEGQATHIGPILNHFGAAILVGQQVAQ